MQTIISMHIKGLNRQTPHPLWPVPKVVTGNKKLPGNNQEPYLLLKLRREIIIHAPSEIDCIPTPFDNIRVQGVGVQSSSLGEQIILASLRFSGR